MWKNSIINPNTKLQLLYFTANYFVTIIYEPYPPKSQNTCKPII